MAQTQRDLHLGVLQNRELFSNNWLEQRLPLEPDWERNRKSASACLDRLTKLWDNQKDLVEDYGGEQQLEHAFIQPVFKELGWQLFYQTTLRGRKPDYALFLDEESLKNAVKAGRGVEEFWRHPKLVADAKAWHVSLDRSFVEKDKREFPPEQIEWYLDRSRLDYGILTNGRIWRLVPRELSSGQPRFETYLEVNLPALIEEHRSPDMYAKQRAFGDFLCFFLFFGPQGHREVEQVPPLVLRARKGSSEYRLGVGEGLKERVFEALRLCVEGFLKYKPNNLDSAADLESCREQSFIFLYRLLFILYAEDRGLLPYRKHPIYTKNYSLGRWREEIASILGQDGKIKPGPGSPKDTSVAYWSDLKTLFDLIDRGNQRYGVPPYNGGLFDPEDHAFLDQNALPDSYLVRVLDQLSRATDPDHQERGLFSVDYRDLRIEHLGSIYEGLLEMRSHLASEPLVEIRLQAGSRKRQADSQPPVIPARLSMPEGYEATGKQYAPGEIYLLTDKGERRASGSYYTPNHIVDYLVEKALRPLCEKVGAHLSSEIEIIEKKIERSTAKEKRTLEQSLSKLKRDFDDRILRLRVLDPSMGSGHFLIRACQYLAEEIATHPHAGNMEADLVKGGESTLTFWKRRVAERCLYGVDLNPMAVELAKLALWLETVSTDQPLTFLDHHLRHGNSLVGAPIAELSRYAGKDFFESKFAEQIKDCLPQILQPLAGIRSSPSNTPEQVKAKAKLHRQALTRLQPFVHAADLWTAAYYLGKAELPNGEQYGEALATLSQPLKHKKLIEEPWFDHALKRARKPDAAFFHWELEFPEVFLERREEPERNGGTGTELDGSRSGFDAVIGNPPYDVLSERETGHDLGPFKAYLEAQERFKPSFRGKSNLYKLFICQALHVLADGGRLCFIVPMPLLGDDQAAELRRSIFKSGAFESIEAFPQKDDPRRRVFPEAKLSTVAFSYLKSTAPEAKQRPFLSRVHPAECIEEASPRLKLTMGEIPLYDPENLTIVSCSQADWDLALKVIGNGRMTRLKDFAEFFQGEVNETNERAKGNLIPPPGKKGKLVIRGANICLYVARKASQGEDLFLSVESFLRGKGPDTKAHHYKYRRVGLQESCPQNNFRRIITALLPAGDFCNHKVNYLPEHKSKLPLEVALALLNSKLADWFFRLGSTNAAVSHYQLYNLPCPKFVMGGTLAAGDAKAFKDTMKSLDRGDTNSAFEQMTSYLNKPPFSAVLRYMIVEITNRICLLEKDRGTIKRVERSGLDASAQPLQDLLDRIFYAMAGLSSDEVKGLEGRLAKML